MRTNKIMDKIVICLIDHKMIGEKKKLLLFSLKKIIVLPQILWYFWFNQVIFDLIIPKLRNQLYCLILNNQHLTYVSKELVIICNP